MAEAKRIIIADDEVALRMPLAFMIRKKFPHVQVDEVSNGSDLYARLLSGVYSAVVTDNDMPGGTMDGIEVITKIRRKFGKEDLPIYLMSGKEEVKEDALVAGANGFFQKPFPTNNLLEALAQYLPK